MKKAENKHRKIFTMVMVMLAIVGWVSIPLFKREVKAGGVPILVRTANLVSPTGSVNPHGAAEYQVYANGHRELEVEIEDVNLSGGTSLTATVNGTSVGQLTLDIDGRGRLKLKTEDGQIVPAVNDGDTVNVKNGSTVLVVGVFGGGGPTPSPTASPTGSPSPSPSPTGSPSPSPSPTGSPSPSPSPTGSPGESSLFAALTGNTVNGVLPSGYAEFEVHSSRIELEIRVRQINLPPGISLSVLVDNAGIGFLSLENNGEGRLQLRTDNGQTVPAVVAGSTIQIKNGGTTILAGTFSGFVGPSPTPSPTGTPGPTPSPTPVMGRSFEAHLTGTGTAATGEFKVTLNASETQATIFGEFHNLSSNQTGARVETTTGTPFVIHSFGMVGGNNGNFASVNVTVSAALVQQLRTGLWSAVITSVNDANGEISGQFTPRSNRSDFDGDGSNDFAVFRPSTGTWFSLNSTGFTVESLGSAQDTVVSADYDGDGKTDKAVFKPLPGGALWEIKRSSDGGTTMASFGEANDIPARGDYDGDGRSDIAVFRPSNGKWYIKTSGNWGYSVFQFGIAGDVPVPGDMDGDGKDDIVVFRPIEGKWYWLGTANGGTFNNRQFGVAGDIPVAGDFDGDGKNDVAVFRPSNGTWYSHSATSGFRVTQFGVSGDVPVSGDYDSDGRTDIAVFRPSNGCWYIIRSSDNSFQTTTFGIAGDVPVVTSQL